MQTVLIVVHLMVVIALVGVVLLQRSEGGALGMGGGGSGGGMMSARGAADALTRTTGILAAAFFITSISLGIFARYESRPTDILDQIEQTSPGGQNILDQLGGSLSPSESSDSSADIPAPTQDGTQVPTGQ